MEYEIRNFLGKRTAKILKHIQIIILKLHYGITQLIEYKSQNQQ